MTERPLTVLAVADSDSYLKWGAATLGRMPQSWTTDLVVVETPAVPSARQVAAALAGTVFETRGVDIRGADEIARRVAAERPDIVLLSVRGPVVRVLVRAILGDREARRATDASGARAGRPGGRGATTPWRPVLVSGLPGISIPATRKALYYRAQVDALILHSAREIDEFRALAATMGVGQRFALSTLPFLADTPRPTGTARERGSRDRAATDIVFAAQAKVPREKSDREHVLRELATLADADPSRRVVLKLRGLAGEPQTHAERYPYDTLLAELPEARGKLVIDTGPMSASLDTAAALVTVSSTAAIEAVHRDIPVLVLDDFGVSNGLINTVFEGSGLLGPLSSLATTGARLADARWLDDNYFHAPDTVDCIAVLETLVVEREAGTLAVRPQFRGTLGGTLRRVWDRKRALGRYDRSAAGFVALAVGMPARYVVLAVRAARRSMRSTSEDRRMTRP
ncbi:DUF6716 putative glycosyltransferase [Marisediminicola sp. LYQ134]|uniref:DUF6716 putative glycosyltransferase n=1 Tax=Marisediminicola sp. LYQ134 TaxID=3391061 RepID=UPI003983362D